MKDLVIGVHIVATDAASAVDGIVLAEQAGVDCAWLTCGSTMPDPLVVFGAAAMKTQRIALGTAVIPTFPRHPLAMVQSAIAVDTLAPGRLRLGVGPSHRMFIEGMFGIPFERPLEHLREYLTVLRAALYEGKTDFDGKRLHGHSQNKVTKVSVLASALRENAFKLCGELSDGAISWMCPLNYLRDVALPAMKEGAREANRAVPPLIAHVPMIVNDNVEQVRAIVHEQLGRYPQIPYYQAMLIDAGFPEATEGKMSDRMVDALVVHGNAEQVKARLRLLPSFGMSELLATPVLQKDDPAAFATAVRVLGELAAQ